MDDDGVVKKGVIVMSEDGLGELSRLPFERELDIRKDYPHVNRKHCPYI